MSHPNESCFVAITNERKILKWSTERNTFLQSSRVFYHDILAADWSSDGSLIAMTDESGKVYILDHDSMDIIDKLTSSFANNKTLENP